MTAGAGVFSPEGWAEGVDVGKSESESFCFELTADGEIGRLAEEVLGRIFFGEGVSRLVVIDCRRDLEHRSCTLSIARGDDWGVDVVESARIEESVDGLSKLVSDAKDRAEGVSSDA